MSVLTSPHLIDFIIAATLLEAAVVVLCRGLAPLAIVRMLAPGVWLMLALRAALAQAVWPWVPMALTGALISHIFDLRGRWQR